MSTIGVAPPDFSSDTGKFRLLIGDTNATDVNAGQGDYLFFSDDEIDGYLTLNTSIYRAAGLALNALAAQAANEAESIKDYDLAVDRRQRAEQFREQAKQMFAQADIIDAEGDGGFRIVRTGRPKTTAELAEFDLSDIDYTDYIV